MKTVVAGMRPANPAAGVPTPLELLRIRVALIERIDAAAERGEAGRAPEASGMPPRLFAAGCYLAAHGYDEIACEGERCFKVDFGAYRQFAGYADMIELGREAIYSDGGRSIAPLQSMEQAA